MQLKAKDIVRQAITLEPDNTLYDTRNVLDMTLAELLLLRITNHWELLQRKIFRDSYSEKCQIDAYTNSAYMI